MGLLDVRHLFHSTSVNTSFSNNLGIAIHKAPRILHRQLVTMDRIGEGLRVSRLVFHA